ncbi:zincin-like metallopeptidase domain-containing protein [Cyanobium sp. ATX 6F1]|uniref:zincin-like metallopeptidase domain-containing protein n=1 Tax=unclassified Cyanobium TaxID=2627006 RepID=UPI0028F420BA|nr:zincin-like metallopeptidase domain-containing protein [Cyanobium sp. ATX 6F1]
MHGSMLKRQGQGRSGSFPVGEVRHCWRHGSPSTSSNFSLGHYAREALVAELGAVLLGDRLEIGSEIESHAAYLGHWIELLQESPRVLFQVLSEARQAADLNL